jgi:[acyl-carrier-protein] S-malonyltransferase
MKKAVDDFRQFMEEVPFSSPETDVLFNATAEKETNPEQIKDIMAQQLVSPVKWYAINLKMLEDGIDTVLEVGPKKVLSGLLKKNIPKEIDLKIFNVGDVKTLNSFLETVRG